MSIEIVPTNAAIGAEIRGIDLSQPIDDETFANIEAAFDTHGVIILRDQRITPEQQVAFSARFGECEINHNAKDFSIEGNPEIYLISNIKENGRAIGTPRAGSKWHTDMTQASVVPMAIAIQQPTIVLIIKKLSKFIAFIE